MSVWLGEAVLIATGQRCIRLVVVGSVLAVIAPQGALRAPLLQGVCVTLLQSWPVGQKVIAVQLCGGQREQASGKICFNIIFNEINLVRKTFSQDTFPNHTMCDEQMYSYF